MINSCSGLTTSAIPELRLKQSDEFINGEKYVHRLNPLNHDVTMKTSNGGGNWTFMAYLDGDNDIEPFYIDSFLNMSSVGSTSEVSIVVQFDRIPGEDSRFGNWTDCKRFYITKDLTPTAENAIQNLTEVNMGDPDTLTDFVNWAINSFPADSYCLVLMDHGSGYVNGVCFDDTSGGDALSLSDLSQALSAVPEKMDVLYFDACLMGMIEVAYQIRDYADIMIASEEVAYAGEPYEYYLANLTANPLMSPSELADVIVSNYIEFTAAQLAPSTMSGVDLSQMSSLKTAVDNLAQSLKDSESIYNDEIRLARGQTEGYLDPADMYGWYMDLYHFAQLIYQYIPDADIRNNASQVMTLLSSAVVVEGHYHHPNSHGLSTFFPCKRGSYYNYFMSEYSDTDFASDTMWDEFIDYHVDITPAKPDFVVVDVYWEPLNPMPGEEVTFYAELANQGTKDESYVSVHVYLDGDDAYGTFDFPAGYVSGYYDTIYVQWTATAGNHSITWIIDKDNTRDEWNETNNEMTKNFTLCALTVQTPYSYIQVWIDGDEYTTDFYGDVQTYVDPGFHSVEVPDFVSLGTRSRGAFVQWDDGNLSNPRDVFVENSLTLNATYVIQYNVTFVQSGSGGSPHVTVDGTEYQLPCSLWLEDDSSHTFSYESPVSGGTGVQYIIDYASYASPFTVSYATTITTYYTTQFYITITSAHGTPTSSQWVNEGYSLAVSVQSPAETIAEQTRWRCTGFSIGQASIQSGTSYTFYNIQEPHKIEFNWIQQFWLEVTTSVSGVTVLGTGWHDSGTSVTCTAPTASGYTFDCWIIDGVSQQKGVNSITVTMNAPHEVTAQYVAASSTDLGGGSGGSSGGGGGSGGSSAGSSAGSGAGSSTDNAGPSIGNPSHQPKGPMPDEVVTVLVDVTDDLSGVSQVILSYRINTSGLWGAWINVDMKLDGDTCVGEIPGFALGTHVQYRVKAYDNAGNEALRDKGGEYYSYVVPEFSDFIIVGLFMLLTLVATALTKIRHKATSRKAHNLTCKSNSKTCCHQNAA